LGIGVGILIQEKDIFSSKKPLQRVKDFSIKMGEKQPLVVVLSFDYEDLNTQKGKENLPSIFRVLDKHNATATFFIVGRTAEMNPEEVRKIYERNYSLGLHTYYHNYPIFNPNDAALIGEFYNKSPEYEWERSFKTKEAFYKDILRNRASVMEAIENATTPTMFRCPSLTINWTRDPAYFEVLKMAGILIDSSIYQDFSNPRASYTIGGILEVPVTASDFDYQRIEKLKAMAKILSDAEAPLVLFLHPSNIKDDRLYALDNFLVFLEENYKVEYLKIEDIES
jgi:peptidoglycan/xylan/chitin deacetylase (PgdA/CDA1 family)